ESVETYNQWKKIDIWITINKKIAIIIEDKIKSKIHGTREKDQLHKYEYEANFWCNKHNCKPYFAFLRTSPFTGDERLYLNEHHKNVWKVIRRKDLVNLFNKHSNVVNNIYLDYVEVTVKYLVPSSNPA
ncbi:PD-(D/E)XK nuclease family protein, partial [Succinivibrio sp.]|uniref:PD-(D/E)XK nuclease family protein n=1 Tax=Succinivibrio sp. TaxID=2053619 RepID=UPI00386D7E39